MEYLRLQISSILVMLLILSVSPVTASPQSAPGTPDPVDLQGVTFQPPTPTGVIGQKSTAAIAELQAHIAAVNVSSFKDLQATGTLTYANGEAYPASLNLLGTDYSRLDITMSSGVHSLRLRGTAGAYQTETGRRGHIPPSTSIIGILALPRVWLALSSPFGESLVDDGVTVTSGETLHRITVEFPLYTSKQGTPGPTVATDLYFDPATHLLLYSVDSSVFSESRSQLFTRVTSYGSYKATSGVLVPTSIQQSLNGQVQWSLQLTQVTLNNNPSTGTFSF